VSGIVGIVNLDGAPVNPGLLSAMTQSLAFRGPDAQNTKCLGAVGLGNTLLRTTKESSREQQPASLDGRIWITSDARIDARSELIEKLQAKGRQISAERPDTELILHAYLVWGNACVEHLLGDFVFAIWDGPEQRLFCARDQFGVRSFYYSRVGNSVVFSNTLDCLRMHPAVSDRLNDLAIADFLLLESSQDPGATAYSDIARLEPAHTLEAKGGRVSVRRYWTLPAPALVQAQHPMECVERFKELMDIVVADRVRTGPAGVLMSGGLDSSVVAAGARGAFSRAGAQGDIRAYTQVFHSLIPHDERPYAGLVADALHIPIEYQAADGYALFDGASPTENTWPEPTHIAWAAPQLDQLREVGKQCRVALTGFGGDPTLSCRISVHFGQLLKRGNFGRALVEALRFFSVENRWSRLYFRKRWHLLFGSNKSAVRYPTWMNPELENRYQLRQRFDELIEKMPAGEGVRPIAYSSMMSTMWPCVFESLDPEVTRCSVEVCHPFFDLRLVDFLLSLPALPWCSDKELLREAGRGILPDEVRLRRKTTLPMDPALALLQKPASAWVDQFEGDPRLGDYVIRDRVPRVFQAKDSWEAYINLRPLSLNYWLQRVAVIRYKELGLI
jgi:asparagine synthase (glutamine-hydrolysing)